MQTTMTRTRPGPPISEQMPARWRAFTEALGGKTEASRILGVSLSTYHRWANLGRVIPLPLQKLIRLEAQARGLSDPTLEHAPSVCPQCLGKGRRPLTYNESKEMALKDIPRNGLVECECVSP